MVPLDDRYIQLWLRRGSVLGAAVNAFIAGLKDLAVVSKPFPLSRRRQGS